MEAYYNIENENQIEIKFTAPSCKNCGTARSIYEVLRPTVLNENCGKITP